MVISLDTNQQSHAFWTQVVAQEKFHNPILISRYYIVQMIYISQVCMPETSNNQMIQPSCQ